VETTRPEPKAPDFFLATYLDVFAYGVVHTV